MILNESMDGSMIQKDIWI